MLGFVILFVLFAQSPIFSSPHEPFSDQYSSRPPPYLGAQDPDQEEFSLFLNSCYRVGSSLPDSYRVRFRWALP